ncbi:sulfotransferase [Candidatus Parcubacteria bacterium]|nr:sulfotransferase [Candidatus Parcubacteria bacterium]
MNTFENNKTVIVLGMHRSGTSAVAGVINSLGVSMGEKHFIKKDYKNPFGYYEDLRFIELNKKILNEQNNDITRVPSAERIMAQKEKYRDQIKKLLAENSKIASWGWKDPRTVLTIDLFYPYIKNPYFIICERASEEIAKSLKRRDGLELQIGIELADEYKNCIKNFLNNNEIDKLLWIKFEDLINDSERIVQEISEFIQADPTKRQLTRAINSVKNKNKIKFNKALQIIKYTLMCPGRAFKYIRNNGFKINR